MAASLKCLDGAVVGARGGAVGGARLARHRHLTQRLTTERLPLMLFRDLPQSMCSLGSLPLMFNPAFLPSSSKVASNLLGSNVRKIRL